VLVRPRRERALETAYALDHGYRTRRSRVSPANA
jgi:hypothetical protein